jgi:hypothetical protein
MRVFILLISSIVFGHIAIGQNLPDTGSTNKAEATNLTAKQSTWNDRDWNLIVAYSYQKYHIINIGIGRLGQRVYIGSCAATDPDGGDGLSVSMQAYYKSQYTPLYAPTLSWEASFNYLFKAIIQANYITNFHQGDVYLKPEIGLNIVGFFINYGYSIGLTNNLKDIGLSKGSINIGGDIALHHKS